MNNRLRRNAYLRSFFLSAAGLGQKIRRARGDDPITQVKSADEQDRRK